MAKNGNPRLLPQTPAYIIGLSTRKFPACRKHPARPRPTDSHGRGTRVWVRALRCSGVAGTLPLGTRRLVAFGTAGIWGSSPRLSPAWCLRNGFGEKICNVRSFSPSKRGRAVPLRCPIRCPQATNLGVCLGEAPGPVPSAGTRPRGAHRRHCRKESTASSPKPCSTEPGWLHPRLG